MICPKGAGQMLRVVHDRKKEYVGVNAVVTIDGTIEPKCVFLHERNSQGSKTGRIVRFGIDRVLDHRPAASHVGGFGERYLVRILGCKTFIFHEYYQPESRFYISDGPYGEDWEPVEVNVNIDDIGNVVPMSFTTYQIDSDGLLIGAGETHQINHASAPVPGSTLKGECNADRFVICTKHKDTFLFYENRNPDSRFFVEKKVQKEKRLHHAK